MDSDKLNICEHFPKCIFCSSQSIDTKKGKKRKAACSDNYLHNGSGFKCSICEAFACDLCLKETEKVPEGEY